MLPKGQSTAVHRALSILELAVQRSEGVSHSDVHHQLRIPKASTTMLLRTLEHRGYLRRDATTGRFRVGLKVLGLGRGALEFVDLRRAAGAELRALVETTRLTAHLAILDHGRAVYIDRAESPGFLRINTWVGRDLAVHTTAVGKALLWDHGDEEVRTLLSGQELEAKTTTTITSVEGFLRELRRVRRQGYAVDDEENNVGVRCVAAPIFDPAGTAKAAIGLSGATSHVTRDAVPKLAALVCRATLRVSRHLGYSDA